MKALTLWQPWASLVAIGVKTIETRSWATKYRGPLAIHAAKHSPLAARKFADDDLHVRDALVRNGYKSWHDLPQGCVIATCSLVDAIRTDALRWHDGHEIVALLDQWWAFGSRVDEMHTRSDSDLYVVHERQRRFVDFSPGRYAWLLGDVLALPEPIQAKGRQGLWEWDR